MGAKFDLMRTQPPKPTHKKKFKTQIPNSVSIFQLLFPYLDHLRSVALMLDIWAETPSMSREPFQ